MPPAGFESPIAAREQPQTHALDHTVTGIGGNPTHVYFIRQNPMMTTLSVMGFHRGVPSSVFWYVTHFTWGV
jgi:hypothetical protein